MARGSKRFVLALLIVMLLAACTEDDPTPFSIPDATLTLVPPTPTITPSPIPPSPSSAGVRPFQLPTPTVESANSLPPSASLGIQAAIAELRRLANLDSTARINILSLKTMVWSDGRLGCDTEIISKAELTAAGVPGYRVVLGIESQGFVFHTDREGVATWCAEEALLSTAGEPLAFDPVTRSLADLASSDLVQRLNVDPSLVSLVDISAMTWQNSSQGCPRPDINYVAEQIPGYRLVLQVSNTDYVYHSNGLQVDFCPPEFEVLPPPFAAPKE